MAAVSIADEGTTGVATWQDAAWRDAALAWAAERLAERGLVVTGRPEQLHVRPWSTAIRLRAGDDSYWLKSVGSGSGHEPALSVALGGWVPRQVLVPLAADPARRLLLLPDGGQTLRAAGGTRIVEAWEALLAGYARLQIALAAHTGEMLALGVPDTRPDRLPSLVGRLVDDEDALHVGGPDGLDPAVRDRVFGALDRYADDCRLLAAGPVPATLQHDDLHDANVFVAGNAHRFFDWGDASVSHPFLSLLVPLRMAGSALDLPRGHPVLLRLREAYLYPWRGFADLTDLRELAAAALRVAALQRALTWHRILMGIHPDERAEWRGSVSGWVAEHLEPGPMAGVPGA